MIESRKVEKLKEDSLKLFKFRANSQEYERRAIKIVDKVHDFKLEHTIDPGEFRFFLINPVRGKKLSAIDSDEFHKSIEDYLKPKRFDYFFQLLQLTNFPTTYKLGFGMLFTFDLLPKLVKDCAKSLSKGKVPSVAPSLQKIWSEIIPKLTIPADPKAGHWLKISVSAISSTRRLERAFEHAEESLDILRMAISTARFHIPRYAIALSTDKKTALPVAKGVELSKYVYNPRHQSLIDELSPICTKPSSELERRIKNAIRFYRIADNNSPDHHKLFFYIAAVDNLILGANDRDVLRWKFSEKGAILLSDKLKERLDLVKELRTIYDKRSTIAHGGEADYDFLLTTSSRSHFREIALKLMHLISKSNLRTVAQKKSQPSQSLDEYLNNIIYS